MKKVQNAEKQDRALDELYKRYENRGMNYDSSPEYADQEGRAIHTRSIAPKSYRVSGRTAENLYKYKNGVSGARKYMTDGDFADYYKATREYTPDGNFEPDTAVILQKIDRERYRKNNIPEKNQKADVKEQLKREADRSNPKRSKIASKNSEQKPKSPSNASSKIKEVAKVAAKTWIPLEEMNDEKVVEGKKTKIPTNVILAIVVITVSLLLIVGSTVLLGTAQSEQNELEEMIEGLDKEIEQLQGDLDRKNADVDIDIFAQEHGMINQEHVNAEYIDSYKTDGVIKHENEKFSLTSLINWFFGILN